MSSTARHRLHDTASREAKARKILTVLQDALGPDLSPYVCLDIGCSLGLITHQLAPHFRQMLAIEYDAQAINRAAQRSLPHLGFIRADALALPLRDASVDVVLCTQVYEHVADPHRLFAEIWRVLVPGGYCFFSGPNRLYPIEMHYNLPLVQWLPRAWADAWLSLMGRETPYDVHSFTLWTLRRALLDFQIRDYAVDLLRNPSRYAVEGELGRLKWLRKLPLWALRCLEPLVPNFNWLLRKSEARAP